MAELIHNTISGSQIIQNEGGCSKDVRSRVAYLINRYFESINTNFGHSLETQISDQKFKKFIIEVIDLTLQSLCEGISYPKRSSKYAPDLAKFIFDLNLEP